MNTYQRDGAMRFDANGGLTDNYEPNGFGGPSQAPDYSEPPLRISGDAARYDASKGNDNFTQAGNLFRLLAPAEQQRMTAIIAGTLVTVNDATVATVLENFHKCDPKYGELIKTALAAAKQKHAVTPPAGR